MTQTVNINDFEKELEDLNKIFYQTTERENKMAQAGSIQQKTEVATGKLQEINSLINEYNQRGAEILMRKDSDEFQNYQPDYVSKLIEEETQKHLASFQTRVEKFLGDVLGWLTLSLNQKEEIRFPFRSSKDFNKAQLGEMKSLRAQNFVSASKNNLNLIQNELFAAYRSGDDDYFNSLVNFVLMQDPKDELEKSVLSIDHPELTKLFGMVRNVYKEFEGKNNLQILTIAIITLTTVATEANSFLAAIKGSSIFFLPQRMAEKMDQNEVARNIEMVNASMPYWGTKLESLNFVFQIV